MNNTDNNIKQFVKNATRQRIWNEVVAGKTALILNETKTGSLEELVINAKSVYVKCNHCGKITNKQICNDL
jgi:hypothetical protein